VTGDVFMLASGASPAEPTTTSRPGTPGVPDLKFVQTTYYSCVTIGTYSHCGIHEPILDASAASNLRASRKWAVIAVGLGLAFLLGT